MTFSKNFFFALIALLASVGVKAQGNLSIVGDTIHLSTDLTCIVKFPDDITNVVLSCPKENYDTKAADNTLKIKAGVEAPVSPCMLLVEEGAGKSSRSHTFVLLFQTTPVTDFYHDFHTVDKIKDRIAYLESFRPKPVVVKTEPVVNTDSIAKVQAAAASAKQDETDPNKIVLDGLTIDRKELDGKIVDKITRLNNYMQVLVNRQFANNDYRKIVDNALHLFNDDTTRKVQVNNTSGISTKSIRKYLLNLAQLPYDHVDIKFHDIQFISKLVPQPDGTYRGSAVFMQEFTGKKGEREYRSTDEKSIEVIMKIWDELKNGEEQKKWDVFLGNITVQDSKKG